jgi:hypothetical protein
MQIENRGAIGDIALERFPLARFHIKKLTSPCREWADGLRCESMIGGLQMPTPPLRGGEILRCADSAQDD